jgi:hypothetical protein
MEFELPIRLVLVNPPAGVDFGIQKGQGVTYETLFAQQRKQGDISFDFSLTVKDNRKDGSPNFVGPLAQGTVENRFIYVDVGTYAGQKDTRWSRRMKVPLEGISRSLIRSVMNRSGHTLLARIPGAGKDGSPSCATVKLLGDWEIVKARRRPNTQ